MRKLVLVTIIAVSGIFSANNIYAQYKNNAATLSVLDGNSGQRTKTSQNNTFKSGNKAMDKRMGILKQELSLNEKQSAEVRKLLENHFEKAAKIRAQNKEKETFSEKIQLKAARIEFHSELKNILDKDQRKKLKAFREKRKEEKKTTAHTK